VLMTRWVACDLQSISAPLNTTQASVRISHPTQQEQHAFLCQVMVVTMLCKCPTVHCGQRTRYSRCTTWMCLKQNLCCMPLVQLTAYLCFFSLCYSIRRSTTKKPPTPTELFQGDETEYELVGWEERIPALNSDQLQWGALVHDTPGPVLVTLFVAHVYSPFNTSGIRPSSLHLKSCRTSSGYCRP
jgi:hypothetical protein